MSKKIPELFIGTSGWSYQDWRKKFYPPEIPQSHWLEFYSNHFKTVEINATFYRSFPNETYEKWYQSVPSDFHFVIKISRYITHRKHLIDIEDSVRQAEESALLLKDKLGLMLLQLPPAMPYNLDRLQAALSAFKNPSKVVIEFRNTNWLTAEAKKIMRDYKAIFCNIDSPHLQVQTSLTSQIAYIRLHGHTKMYNYNYTHLQLEEIGENAEKLVRSGAKQVYIFFNNDYHANAIRNAKVLIELLKLKHDE